MWAERVIVTATHMHRVFDCGDVTLCRPLFILSLVAKYEQEEEGRKGGICLGSGAH